MTDKRFNDGIPQGRLRRVAPMAGATARTAGEAVVVALRTKATGQRHEIDHDRAAERYARALGRSRGALMKAGQAMSFVSMSPAVAPEMRMAFQQALGRLCADAPPMPAATARAVLERELGRPVSQLFASVESEPIAAASIGQVHRAAMLDGTPVAVKIQYPGAREAIEADLANHELLSTFLGLFMGLSPVRVALDLRALVARGRRVRAPRA